MWTACGRHVDRARIEKPSLSGSGIVSFKSQSPRERQDQGRGHPIAPSFRKIHPPTVNPSRRRTPRHEILASWGISLIGAIFGLWHENGEEYESYDGNRCKVEKSRRVAIPLYDESRCQLTQARADADSQRDKTLRKIEATCAAHQVGSDEDCDDAENPRGNPIEHLDSDNAVRIGREREQQAANRQDRERNEKNALAPETGIDGAADTPRNATHHQLRDNNASRQGRGIGAGMR